MHTRMQVTSPAERARLQRRPDQYWPAASKAHVSLISGSLGPSASGGVRVSVLHGRHTQRLLWTPDLCWKGTEGVWARVSAAWRLHCIPPVCCWCCRCCCRGVGSRRRTQSFRALETVSRNMHQWKPGLAVRRLGSSVGCFARCGLTAPALASLGKGRLNSSVQPSPKTTADHCKPLQTASSTCQNPVLVGSA